MSSSNDLEQNAKELQSIGQEERGKQMGESFATSEQQKSSVVHKVRLPILAPVLKVS